MTSEESRQGRLAVKPESERSIAQVICRHLTSNQLQRAMGRKERIERPAADRLVTAQPNQASTKMKSASKISSNKILNF